MAGWSASIDRIRPTPAPAPAGGGDELIARAPALRDLKQVAADVARRRSTVMLLGETGSGKEVIARYVHAKSPRFGRPFVPVDCSALADTLLESQLFGHVRGAFTGAARDSLGFVRSADGGTLFLDEIGELSLPMQAKLLRVLQERRVTPVGAFKATPVDIRVLCATHRDLPAMVAAGTFRQDLFYRLNVVVLHVPPLRARTEDVAALARHFLQAQAALYDEPTKHLSPAAAAALMRHDWPGNVRELANVIEHAHVLAGGDEVGVEHLPPVLQPTGEDADGDGRGDRRINLAPPSDLWLAGVERRTIAEALRRTRNNKAAATRLLGIHI